MIPPLSQKAFCKGEPDTTEASNAKRGPTPWNGRPAIGEAAIGRAVRVYRKEENDWFTATVAAYDSTRTERRRALHGELRSCFSDVNIGGKCYWGVVIDMF